MKTTIPIRTVCFLTLVAVTGLALAAEQSATKPALGIELAAPFRDNAVLQRDMPLPVWGWSKPGITITVEFGGQKERTKVGADGKWLLKLKPLKASAEPAEMLVSDGEGKPLAVKNILVGEVWHACGQSNMEWFASKSMCSGLAQEIARTKNEVPVREFRTDTVSALYLQKQVTSEKGWKTSRAAGDFSALALAFAYELHKELKVPVGILLTSHSNTRIEAFTERRAIEAHAGLKVDADLIHDGDVSTEQGRAVFEKYYRDLAAWQTESAKQGFPVERPLKRPNLPGIAGEWRGPSQFFNGKIAPVVPYAIRGSLWCQGESNSGDGRLYAARMEALVRGWREAWGQTDMPFYFTQMQNYGAADSTDVGFADIRQVQHLFFMKNRDHVGMVVQTDLNPAASGNIHYQNKLHPGMRLARWALAREYQRDVAYTGPIYESYTIEGNKAVVSFEKETLFGGLMVGSKGLEKDFQQDPGKYVEPARPTPTEKLNHFRLCSKDRKWHAAEAVIVGDTVVVTSKDVPEPVGVQYAYSEAPQNANLYNKAGLPATPFAAVNGKLIFEEDDLEKVAALKARYAPYTDPDYPILQVAEYYRDGAIIQRGRPIPVWGHANQGVAVTVTLGGVTQSAVANDRQQWSVSFPALTASTQPITLSVKSSHGHSRTVQNILVGDVWFVTGGALLTSEPAFDRRNKQAVAPEAMPLVREFRRRTAASTNPVPKKRGFEVGGGKYRTFWQTADFKADDDCVSMFAYEFAKALNRPGIPQGFVTMSSGQGAQMASPLSWTSYAGVKDATPPAFRVRLDALRLQDPSSDVSRKATADYVQSVKSAAALIADRAKQGADLTDAPLQFPAFPEPGQGGEVKPDTVPTLAYNWCVSPLTPMNVSGVIWVPGTANLGYVPADYSAELELYARSLPATFGQDKVPFVYAQPSAKLVPGVAPPKIDNAIAIDFDAWPKGLLEIAVRLGAAVGQTK
ncbi:MAG: sialate O-acetylesterase [Acidobacteria bacterium]|nr:sialate O-acetylesterase [Acidobacteriota bacterium]